MVVKASNRVTRARCGQDRQATNRVTEPERCALGGTAPPFRDERRAAPAPTQPARPLDLRSIPEARDGLGLSAGDRLADALTAVGRMP